MRQVQPSNFYPFRIVQRDIGLICSCCSWTESSLAVVSSSSYIAVSITYNTSSVSFVGRPLLRSISMDNASWTAKLSGDIKKFLSCAGIPWFILHLLWLYLESNSGTSIGISVWSIWLYDQKYLVTVQSNALVLSPELSRCERLSFQFYTYILCSQLIARWVTAAGTL